MWNMIRLSPFELSSSEFAYTSYSDCRGNGKWPHMHGPIRCLTLYSTRRYTIKIRLSSLLSVPQSDRLYLWRVLMWTCSKSTSDGIELTKKWQTRPQPRATVTFNMRSSCWICWSQLRKCTPLLKVSKIWSDLAGISAHDNMVRLQPNVRGYWML